MAHGDMETPSRRAGPSAPHGMITTPHHLATQGGLRILRNGGTAADAAVAAGAILSAVFPHMCGLGGDAFWLLFDAGRRKCLAVNASGRAGRRADISRYAHLGAIPSRGHEAANTVPGMVSGWGVAHDWSRRNLRSRISWSALLEDATAYTHEGAPVSPCLARWLAAVTSRDDPVAHSLQRFDGFRRVFCRDGRPFRQGERLRQADLAETLRIIARDGPRAFYEGEIADRIAADMRRHDGPLVLEDFRTHHADIQEPLGIPWRGFTALNCPPNSQGMASLAILAALDCLDVAAMGEGSADYIHAVVEITRSVFAERDRFLRDPDFGDIPLDELLSPERAARRAAAVNMRRAAPTPERPLDPGGDTIWLGVVDARGNAVSMIQSVYHDFGSGIVAGGTGVLLQNRGTSFSLDPSHPNALEPGKRPAHTLNPAMLIGEDGLPALVYGSMGGDGQPQTQAAVATRIVDFGMAPQEAVTAPRWLFGRSWGEDVNGLRLEGRFPPHVAEDLQSRGHRVSVVEDFSDLMGHAGAILRDSEGFLHGAADPRSDGSAAGW